MHGVTPITQYIAVTLYTDTVITQIIFLACSTTTAHKQTAVINVKIAVILSSSVSLTSGMVYVLSV